MTTADAPVTEPATLRDVGIALAILVVVVVLGGLAWAVLRDQPLTGDEIEPQIAQHFTEILQTEFTADCPDGVDTREGEISDCTVTRVDNGNSSPVFVEAVDDEGHFRFQAGNPMAAFATP